MEADARTLSRCTSAIFSGCPFFSDALAFMATGGKEDSLENWLSTYFREHNIDEEIYLEYVSGILNNGEDTTNVDELISSIEEVLIGVFVSTVLRVLFTQSSCWKEHACFRYLSCICVEQDTVMFYKFLVINCLPPPRLGSCLVSEPEPHTTAIFLHKMAVDCTKLVRTWGNRIDYQQLVSTYVQHLPILLMGF